MFFKVTQSLYFMVEFRLRLSVLISISFLTSAFVSLTILPEFRFEFDRLRSEIVVLSLKNLMIDSMVSI
jgi:hypothetical protein